MRNERKIDDMTNETMKKMELFNFSNDDNKTLLENKYEKYNILFSEMVSGEGMVGKISYLILWGKNEMQELNDDYMVDEFLNDIILFGTDGADTAYGRRINGDYVEVPFIGMDDEEVKFISKTFDGFIQYLYEVK